MPKVEVKKIKHLVSLSEETNAFTGVLYVDGVAVANCKNNGQGGSNDIYPIYTEDEKKREFYRQQIKIAQEFCNALPGVKSDFSDSVLKMDLDFFIGLEVEKDLRKKEVQRVMKKMDKDCLKHIIILSKDKLEKFKNGESTELPNRAFGWKRPIAEIPERVVKEQVEVIKKLLKGDEFIYNTNLPK